MKTLSFSLFQCSSCRRRFMFDESYNDHIRDCIQHKLVGFIREAIQLLALKDARSISSHEFIRRVIFSIKKSVNTLVNYDENVKKAVGTVVGLPKPENVIFKPPIAAKPTVTPDIPKLNLPKTLNPYSTPVSMTKLNINDFFSNSPTESENVTSNTSSPLCGILMRCPECNSTFENLTDLETHNFQFHSNRPTFSTPSTGGQRHTIRRFKTTFERQATREPDTESSTNEVNNRYTKPRRDFRNFNLVSSNNAFKVVNKSIDIIKNNLGGLGVPPNTAGQTAISDNESSLKAVKCSKCEARFYTISHLDLHVAKKHTRSPEPSKVGVRSTNSTPSKKLRSTRGPQFFND